MRDESYEAGYRAGHLQGWLDAVAKLQASGQPSPGATQSPSSADADSRLGEGPPLGQRTTTAAAGSVPTPATPVPADVSISLVPASPLAPLSSPSPTASVPPGIPPQSPAASFQTYPETPAERQARREKRDRQNINITLYVASLLLVAAAALFIGTSLPPMLRFAGVCAVTALFYGAGFVLHARVPRLKPAAVAFTGTGLALVPVTGLALYNFALHHGPSAWLITSLIGTAAYVAAAVRLESRVLVYLSFTFVASTAFSGVSILGGALVWYFAALIAVAVLLTGIALARPRWLPPVYVRPLMVLHPLVVPAVAVAATCVPLHLDKAEYALVIGMCGVYFALMAAVPGRFRLINFYAARAALTVAAAVEIWHLTGRGSDALLSVGLLFAAQAVGLAFLSARLTGWFPQQHAGSSAAGNSPNAAGERWQVDARATFALQLAATTAFSVQETAVGFFRAMDGYGSVAAGTTVPLWVPVALSLATGMVLAAKWAGRAEWAPVAALVLAGIVSPSMGAWPLAGMLLAAAGFWAIRGVFAAGDFRGRLVLGSRLALTCAVPVTVAAVMDDGPGRAEASVFALLLALVCQQLLTALLERAGVRTLAPEATLGVFGAGGALVLVGMPFIETSPDHGLTAVCVIIQLAAAFVIGALVVPRPATEPVWVATVWEALPLGMSVVAATVAFQAVSQGAGNVALLLVVAYLIITAVRLPLRQHRWAYWWFARAAATVLALTAFHQLRRDGGPVVIADEVVHPATVLVTVLALQLCFPLVAAIRRRAPRGILADAGAVLLLQLAGITSLLQSGSADWQETSAAGLVALGAAASGYFLRRVAGAVWLAPFAFVVLLVFSDGDPLRVELILGIFAVYSTLMVVAERQRARKGWYFVAARVLTAGLAVVLSYDITASPTVVSVTFALVLAAQHAVRWVMRSRLADIPFQQAAVWITLAGQALLPLVYVTRPGGVGLLAQDADGGRWVVLLELLLLLVAAVVARRLFNANGARYFAVYAALFGVVALGPLFTFGGTFLVTAVLSHTGTALTLLGGALLATAAGILRHRQNAGRQNGLTQNGHAQNGHQQTAGDADVEHWLWLVTAGSFAGVGLLISPLAADWVAGAAVLVLSTVCFTASHIEDLPVLYPPAAVAALGGSVALAAEAYQDVPGVWDGFLPWLTGAGVASAALYSVRLMRSGPLQAEPVRRWSLAGAAFLGLMLVVFVGIRHDATSWTAAAVLAAAVGVSYREAPARARRIALEVGALLLTVAIQRAAIFELDAPEGRTGRLLTDLPSPFWVVQWYVVLAAVLGGLRYFAGNQAAGRFLVGAASALLSLSGLGIVFGGNAGQQLWVLVLFALLLMAGLGLGERLFVWWGAAGVAVCILWAMRQYTFLLLAFIAVGLIVFAVWRLNRGTAGQAPEAGPEVTPGPESSPPSRDRREPSRRH
ncbi:hypothetical protein AU252_16840 [Pseudarthrobacter sulfonivorans]|uniref:DUF2339 domain-containing protein n=1 Tax=Pseudarthrobacter sulfonivorans TaxID=121292 RepID=A0A0U3RBM4_9MICC|nr:hypothetical protein [Pseudarthrobacter sulfonivorans]ALV42609.1 hypothetical protein AU252_16840 [Pseudarthrobacter sulfonivorans]